MAKMFSSRKEAIDAVQKILFAEDGYCEKRSNANLQSKTANAGSSNITKYWKDLNNLGLMGMPKGWAGGTDWSWCAALQSWAFIKAFGKDAAKKILLHLPFISCNTMGDKAKSKGRLVSDPKRGDIVLFWNGTRFYHTGFVYKVTKTMFHTSEGNTSSSKKVVPNGGQVCKKSYSIAAAKKAGHKFVRLSYSPVIKKGETKKVKQTVQKATESTTKKSTTTKKVAYKIVNTKKDALNCRKTASETGDVIGKFKKGAKLQYIKKANDTFTKVKGVTTSGKVITGFVVTKYLK